MSDCCFPFYFIKEDDEEPILCLDILSNRWVIFVLLGNEILNTDEFKSKLEQAFPHSLIELLEAEEDGHRFSLTIPYRTSIEEIYQRIQQLNNDRVFVEFELED
jgi:hypothetical protein